MTLFPYTTLFRSQYYAFGESCLERRDHILGSCIYAITFWRELCGELSVPVPITGTVLLTGTKTALHVKQQLLHMSDNLRKPFWQQGHELYGAGQTGRTAIIGIWRRFSYNFYLLVNLEAMYIFWLI